MEGFSIILPLHKPEEKKIVENRRLVSMFQVGFKTADLVREIPRIGTLRYANIESAATISNATRNWLILCIMIPDTSQLNTMNTCITWHDMISIVTVTYCPVTYLSTSTVEPDGSWCVSCGACRVIIVRLHMSYTSKVTSRNIPSQWLYPKYILLGVLKYFSASLLVFTPHFSEKVTHDVTVSVVLSR